MMKRIIALSAVALAVSALSGCVAPMQITTSAPVVKTTPDYVAKAEISCLDTGFGKSCQAFKVDVTNNSSQPIKIIWDSTAITWAGNSSAVLPDGYKIADAASPKAPTLVPPHATISKEITPAVNIEFRGGNWRYANLMPTTYNISLGLNVNGKDVNESFDLSMTATPAAVK